MTARLFAMVMDGAKVLLIAAMSLKGVCEKSISPVGRYAIYDAFGSVRLDEKKTSVQELGSANVAPPSVSSVNFERYVIYTPMKLN